MGYYFAGESIWISGALAPLRHDGKSSLLYHETPANAGDFAFWLAMGSLMLATVRTGPMTSGFAGEQERKGYGKLNTTLPHRAWAEHLIH